MDTRHLEFGLKERRIARPPSKALACGWCMADRPSWLPIWLNALFNDRFGTGQQRG
jgi:hypothetical protein